MSDNGSTMPDVLIRWIFKLKIATTGVKKLMTD